MEDDENNINFKEEMKEIGKRIDTDMMGQITKEMIAKLTEVDTDKIVGFELTIGQDLILLMASCDRLGKFLHHRIIKHYGIAGKKDNKKRRKELEIALQSLFIQGLMEMDEE